MKFSSKIRAHPKTPKHRPALDLARNICLSLSESSPDRASLWWRGGWQPCRRGAFVRPTLRIPDEALAHTHTHTRTGGAGVLGHKDVGWLALPCEPPLSCARGRRPCRPTLPLPVPRTFPCAGPCALLARCLRRIAATKTPAAPFWRRKIAAFHARRAPAQTPCALPFKQNASRFYD